MKKLIFLQFNELNFNILKKYLKKDNFKNFKGIIPFLKNTNSENQYELLEPWIQWFTIHSGKSAKEHGVFRLGDCVKSNIKNIYDQLIDEGYAVGAVTPMNIDNRHNHYKYFIPDPWTDTKSDNLKWSKLIHITIQKIVNNNANNTINFKDLLNLFIIFIRFSKLKNFHHYFYLAITSLKFKWRKSLFLDLLLNDIHLTYLKKNLNINLSVLFLNSCAHIQHHYLLNSKENNSNTKNPESIIPKKMDAVYEAYLLYDKILGDYIKNKNFEIILATGLSQSIDMSETYYYRLKNHKEFLSLLDISYKKVQPRMSRDFLIDFHNNEDRDLAFEKLKNISLNNEKIFGILDKRQKSIFATITYRMKLNSEESIKIENKEIKVKKIFVLVALKNGLHNPDGFFYSNSDKINNIVKNNSNVRIIFDGLYSYFKN